MSKRRFFGGGVDEAYRSVSGRVPAFKLVLWNPNRATISQVVLGEATSPEYDLTPYVKQIDYSESSVFENNDDSVATSISVVLEYDPNASPIPITERTLVDGAPVRLWQGDKRVPEEEWIPIFTGLVRGNPEIVERTREGDPTRDMRVLCVERAESYLQTVVTAHSYEQGTDVGKAALETAILFGGLERREVHIGALGYEIGHPHSQLVDIELLSGLAQILFTVGKKPKFDSEGFLIACDTDLAKPPARSYLEPTMVVEVRRAAVQTPINNSVRLVGLSNELTMVVERRKKLANGTITSGFFEDEVRQQVWFSENRGKEDGGRRARNTTLDYDLSRIGDLVGESVSWQPVVEDDGVSVFGGRIVFSTGYDPEIRITLIAVWAVAKTVQLIAGLDTSGTGLASAAAAGSFAAATPGLAVASEGNFLASAGEVIASAAMVAMILSLTEMGRVEWTIFGEPFENVYQEICATAQLAGVLTADIREIELKNHWIYTVAVAETRALELLKRELAKGHLYEITMLDDPLLDVDDVLEVEDRRYYVQSIKKVMTRLDARQGNMQLTAWRIA
jgi:hypothetical protein